MPTDPPSEYDFGGTEDSQSPELYLSSSTERLDDSVLTWFKKRNGDTLKGALAFVPWILQQSYFEGGLDEGQIVMHKGTGAVVFSDASGFTQLTEKLASKQNGAELLSACLKGFYTPLIDLITAYRGDVIKFSGDALTVYFMAVDDTKCPKYNCVVPPHGTYGLPDLGPLATAVLRAAACCIEIHKRLNMFDTGVDGVYFCLHIGVGCGQVNILQVGGIVPPETHVPRCEYIIAGPPLEQISIAEPLAKNGQTCLSPQAWEYVKDCVVEGPPLEDRPDFHLLLRMDESKYTFPTIKHAAMENDNRADKRFRLSELNVIRRYIPSAVFKQIECGTLTYVNEMRNISVIFISGSGLDVMSDKGANQAQELMASVQRSCYAHEGTLNKFLIDDKGMLFLLVFGLPPLVHVDDPTRAVLSCFDMVKVFRRLNLIGRFGVTSGRSYCGVCGSESRMEYTVLGDCVNLSARLMSNAPPLGILCDEETKKKSTAEVVFNALTPIKVKGKSAHISIFQPVLKEPAAQIGLTPDRKIRFPWHDTTFGDGGGGASMSDGASNVVQLCSVKTWEGIVKVQSLLGGQFSKAIHSKDQIIQVSAPSVKPPEGSPFADGGVIVIEGPTGMGKIELAEHIVTHSAVRLQMMPVFGTMGPRPGDSIRLAVELLRSTLGVFRHLNGTVPLDDAQALEQVVPDQLIESVPILRLALSYQTANEKSSDILDTALDVVMTLITILRKQTPVLLVMQFEYGTSLFPKTLEDQTIFWKVITDLAKVVQSKTAGSKPFTMMILCRDADHSNPCVRIAEESNSLLQLTGLTDENILQYMSNYMAVPDQMVPHNLRQFVAKVTLGNPRYIQETIDQLVEDQNVIVNFGANRAPRNLECKDLDLIDLASWVHTDMVGGTVCLLESLDPLDAAVLKMSTCFSGPFTLPDLAASTCSRWAGATHFDFLRLFKALRTLVHQNIIDVVAAPLAGEPQSPRDEIGSSQHFQCNNLLIRSVGGSMVLEAQKKSVKRQALIDRTLNLYLPQRMEALQSKKSVQHIPWYYEQAFRRMM
mmetsp:Transcript_141351/g.249490  ORF Transcript_141351/g.249490 Transcript_141351/m.249490 type:complete len:1044 (+) Transcript_141351:183-3314(+)